MMIKPIDYYRFETLPDYGGFGFEKEYVITMFGVVVVIVGTGLLLRFIQWLRERRKGDK